MALLKSGQSPVTSYILEAVKVLQAIQTQPTVSLPSMGVVKEIGAAKWLE